MSCDGYRKYEMGKISEADFERHIVTCQECRLLCESDVELIRLAREAKPEIQVPFLWERIERELLQAGQAEPRRSYFFKTLWPSVPLVAAVLVVAAVAVLFIWKPVTGNVRLLGQRALERVEKEEQEYMQAIARLEKITGPVLDEIDIEMMSLYRERLATIDAQIEQCQDALSQNPANAHIRRYMLAALQDKKLTLEELMQSQLPPSEMKGL